jgi:hypothetical protein
MASSTDLSDDCLAVLEAAGLVSWKMLCASCRSGYLANCGSPILAVCRYRGCDVRPGSGKGEVELSCGVYEALQLRATR